MSLLQQIRAIEQRYTETVIRSGAAHDDDEPSFIPTGWPSIDAVLGGGLNNGALHEWLGTVERRHEASESQRSSSWTPPLALLIHLLRQAMNNEAFVRYAVWIGRRCVPYGGALIGSDGDRRLLERSIFVMADRPDDRLWAVDLALRCRAVGVVIADGSGFDMAATRRIQLVAKAHHSPVLLARPPWDVHELSAAQTRWLVGTGEEVEANTLNPRWSVELLRCKGRQAGAIQQSDSGSHVWTLEWNRGQGVVRVLTPLASATGHAGCAANDRRAVQV